MRVHEFVFRSVTGATMPLDRWAGQPLLLEGVLLDSTGEPIVSDGFLGLTSRAEDLFQPAQLAVGQHPVPPGAPGPHHPA